MPMDDPLLVSKLFLRPSQLSLYLSQRHPEVMNQNALALFARRISNNDVSATPCRILHLPSMLSLLAAGSDWLGLLDKQSHLHSMLNLPRPADWLGVRKRICPRTFIEALQGFAPGFPNQMPHFLVIFGDTLIFALPSQSVTLEACNSCFPVQAVRNTHLMGNRRRHESLKAGLLRGVESIDQLTKSTSIFAVLLPHWSSLLPAELSSQSPSKGISRQSQKTQFVPIRLKIQDKLGVSGKTGLSHPLSASRARLPPKTCQTPFPHTHTKTSQRQPLVTGRYQKNALDEISCKPLHRQTPSSPFALSLLPFLSTCLLARLPS